MNIFLYDDYKTFVNDWVQSRPNKGRGQYRQISIHLGVSTVIVSQTFKGDRDLNEDNAYKLCSYLEFTQKETDYFILLVQHARAGTFQYREHLKKRIVDIQKEMQKVSSRVADKFEKLAPEVEAIFHSSWVYSAIRVLSSIPQFQNQQSLIGRLNLPEAQTKKAIEFLLEQNLCILDEGRIVPGPTKTYLSPESPLIKTRQVAWRTLGFEKMDLKNEDHLFITAPLSLPLGSKKVIKDILLDAIQKVAKELEKKKGETVGCINIDWFDF